MEHLCCYLSEQVLIHASEPRLLDILVQVLVQQLKHYYKVLPEVETVKHLDNAILIWVLAKNPLQQLRFNTRIISLLLPILANLDRYRLPRVFHIDTAYDLAKSTCIDDLINQVTIAELLPDISIVKPFFSLDLAETSDPHGSHCVDEVI